ncbi:hypothetical protein ACFOZY_00425 [Chungangia koreensis]|uniref:Protein kinase domain-containing protein n=1 Tax=Chungangia koreensis TaxID=752657 RepID=A0ABV8X1A6_9LACT
MDLYDKAHSVIISANHRLLKHDPSLIPIGKGRSAYAFRIKGTQFALKKFFPEFADIAPLEASVYHELKGIEYYPTMFEYGHDYIVMDYIEGLTLFECLTRGVPIERRHIKEVDRALHLAVERGLNPSDIHLRNIILTPSGEIKLIDVARFKQPHDPSQWDDLKRAYTKYYERPLFPKKLPAFLLNRIAHLYKKDLIPF